jgi:cholesterol oxidase
MRAGPDDRFDGHYDAIVVGSGFGGSVTAYRLAEARMNVCVLERGRAYPPGSFARSPVEMSRNFWDPSEGLYGMFDLWSFRHIEAVVSSGLGGGSLIYANVLLRKDPAWFVHEDGTPWPVSYDELATHYTATEEMLRPEPYPVDQSPYRETPKTRALVGAADALGIERQYPPLAVTFGNDPRAARPGELIHEDHPNIHGTPRYSCQLVGECDVGCNYGAKNTLDYNYLTEADRLGADIRCSCEVRSFERRGSERGFVVRYVRHEKDNAGQKLDTHDDAVLPERWMTADRLIVSAGTLGSTYLMLKNAKALGGLSQRLGSQFCGNGDLLVFARRCMKDGKVNALDASRGPVITTALRYPDALDGDPADGRGFYLEDAGVPAFAPWLLQAVDSPGAIGRVARIVVKTAFQRLRGRSPSNLSASASALLGDCGLSAGSLPLLAMGRDVPDGQMSVDDDGYLQVGWRTEKSGPYFDRLRREAKRVIDEFGGQYVDNPIWHLKRRVITVHPLGGCPMGNNADEGVVDPYGSVFGQPDLYVLDGSIVPGPVGPNPSLTIAAIADRAAGQIAAT